jgi:predicted permease
MITCRLAGLTVAATPRHPYYARLMRDYLAPDGAVPELSLSVTEDEISAEDTGKNAGADRGILEALALYRKLSLALPAFGIAAWVCGGLMALVLSRMMGLERRQTGSMFCCGSFTNIGAVGSLVSVMLFGEQTIAIAALYRLCEEIYYFGIAMPVARWHGQDDGGKAHFSLRDFRLEPVLKVILCALGLGITLNLAGVPRPALFGTLSSGAMILGTVCFLLSIGMSLRLSRMTCYVRQSAAISLIKFVGCPLVIVALAMLCGLGSIDNGLPLKVVAILASMPVAMNALIPPSLFDLDLDLANACWVFTTLELIVWNQRLFSSFDHAPVSSSARIRR